MKDFVVAYTAATLLAVACLLQAAGARRTALCVCDLCDRVLTAGGAQ